MPSLVVPIIVALGFVLAGCASSTPPQSSDRNQSRYRLGYPSYRVEPYQVKGVWYTPKVDYNYDETGTASWYGPGFDRQPAANGEIYDMNQLTAAHKTLPLPSIVAVTNLQNGREVRLRVNDRGPFVEGRFIDVSRRAAQLLGFEGSGTAPVRVKIVKEESIQVAEAAKRGEFGPTGAAQAAPVVRTARAAPPPAEPPPSGSRMPDSRMQLTAAGPASLRAAEVVGEPLPVAASSRATSPPQAAAPPEPPVAYPTSVAATPRRYWPSLIGQAHAEPRPAPMANSAAPAPGLGAAPIRNAGRIFVQAGAFAVAENAQRVRARIAALGNVEIVPTSGSGLYRVRLGPMASEAAAERMLNKVIDSGYPGARVISE